MGRLVGETLAACYGVTQDHKTEEEQAWREKPKALQGVIWHGVWRSIGSMVWRSVCWTSNGSSQTFCHFLSIEDQTQPMYSICKYVLPHNLIASHDVLIET